MGDKSVAHPTDRRHSCRRWWHGKLFLPFGAKTCFGGEAARKLDLRGGGGVCFRAVSTSAQNTRIRSQNDTADFCTDRLRGWNVGSARFLLSAQN
jgi:hypothetical protein